MGSTRLAVVFSMLRWLLLAAAGAAGPAHAQAPAPDLTPAERAWIETHPVVKAGVSQEFPPYYMRDPATGQAHGFVVEMMSLWAQRTGLRFEFHRYPTFGDVLAALRRGEIDMTPFTAPLDSRRDYVAYTRPAYQSSLVLAARRDVPDTSTTGDFGGRRIAVEAGTSTDTMLAERYPRAHVERFVDAKSALQAVASGRADLYIGYQHVAVYEIERLLLANIELRRDLGPGAAALGPAVRIDQPLLRDILDKAIESVSAGDRSRLAERWLPVASVRVPLPAREAQLSAAERRWVQDKGRIRVGYDADFAPVTARGPLGEFHGFGADLLRLMADKAGLSIDLEGGSSFADVYEQGRKGELDVVVGMARISQRRTDYDFVGPFMSMPTVLVTRTNEPEQIVETRDIGRRTLALLSGHFLIPELRVRHPGISLMEVDSQEQALAAVVDGAASVAIGNMSVVNELIERRFAGRVMVTGVVKDGDSEIYFAVPRQYPELTRVLGRAFEAVNDSEMAALRQRWLAREVPTGLSWSRVLAVVLPGLTLLLVYLYLLGRGNRRLRRARAVEQEARRTAEDSTAARSRFLAYLSHELRGTLSAVSAAAAMLKADDDPRLRARLLEAIDHSARGLLNVLETTLQHEQSLHTGVKLEPTATDLAAWWDAALGPARIIAQEKGLTLDAHWAGAAPTVQVDAVRLQQVVQNLLNNAIKFTRQGGVTVRGEVLAAATADEPPRLRIEVRDTGPGLSEADRAKLFQAYAQGEQGKGMKLGAGLGLAISAQIVHAMRGTLEAPAQPVGAGACFVLTVPLEAAPTTGDVVTDADAEAAASVSLPSAPSAER